MGVVFFLNTLGLLAVTAAAMVALFAGVVVDLALLQFVTTAAIAFVSILIYHRLRRVKGRRGGR